MRIKGEHGVNRPICHVPATLLTLEIKHWSRQTLFCGAYILVIEILKIKSSYLNRVVKSYNT